ncbi:hypothetical protein [Chitinophaga ginsengisoli]|uniref:Uncharacterized protein n=1 Tax=Chitinophaga ginsengisoli TaxID=363837 RepID=A0A2P8FM93_9BACT|nr:hypothetical protein [Chitinophaga ginsengisoli]PSL22838.1 hypothetical protein CLV42_120100 [Chitinophaga ginsengisoli]
MAKQTSIIPFTGKLGNLIGYERNGEYFLRSMPEIVRQTHATRRAARRFGMASRKAALIRHAFYDDLDIRCDSGHINRLNKALIAAGSNHAAITGFRFNQHTGADRFFTVAPTLFRNGTLHIPSQTIAQYKGIAALEVKVIAARIDFIRGQVTGTATATLRINPDMLFEETNIPLDVPGAGTLVVTLQVRGMHKDCVSGNRQYLAADIIAVAAAQTQKCFSKPTYPRKTLLRVQATPDYIYAHAHPSLIQRE